MRRLLVFLKYPTPGQVKTRLAATVGPEAASEIYRACVELTVERLRPLAPDTTVCVEPATACGRVRAWLGPQWHVHPQVGASLGERLNGAMAEAFQDGARWVVCIGTDSPWLTASEVHEAFGVLGRTDMVIGPAEDGGYYLIGLSQPRSELFRDMAWSSSQVYAQTLEKARALGIGIQALPTGYDLDEFDDVRRFIAQERVRGGGSIWLQHMEAISQRRQVYA